MENILKNFRYGVMNNLELLSLFSSLKKNNSALPAVNCINIDSINAVLEAASQAKSPVIIQFSHKGADFLAGNKKPILESSVYGAICGAYQVHLLSKQYDIPVVLHTDHCSKKNLNWIDHLLTYGEEFFKKTGRPLFSSHMLDLSDEPLEENIGICSEYLKRMTKINMSLEIELGVTGGEEDGVDNSQVDSKKLYTRPEEVCYAYEKLNSVSSNFTIAAAFGNVHGVYKPGNVKLQPEILNQSQQYVMHKYKTAHNPLNFVFHGGSGSDKQDIQKALNYGVIKMNLDTDIQWACWQGVLDFYKENQDCLQCQIGNSSNSEEPNKKYYDPRVWLKCAQNSMVKRILYSFKQLNSFNLLKK